MARKKMETVVETKQVDVLQEEKDKTVKATRTRKKKSTEPAAEFVAAPPSTIYKSQFEIDSEEFDIPKNGLMIHTLSDYEDSKEGFELCTRHIQHLVKATGNNYLKIGVLLNLIYDRHYYRIADKYNWSWDTRCHELNMADVVKGNRRHNFHDIYDFAAYEFGFSRGSVNNFMNIAKRFSENKINLCDGNVYLLPEFESYSVSQLIQLLPYTDEQIHDFIDSGKIHPNMSCRFLRQTLKEISGTAALSDSKKEPESDLIEGQLVIDDSDNIVEEFSEIQDLYQECDKFESECKNESANESVNPNSTLVFSFEPRDLDNPGGVFEIMPGQENISGFTEIYGNIFFLRLYELLSKGYRIDINAILEN